MQRTRQRVQGSKLIERSTLLPEESAASCVEHQLQEPWRREEAQRQPDKLIGQIHQQEILRI